MNDDTIRVLEIRLDGSGPALALEAKDFERLHDYIDDDPLMPSTSYTLTFKNISRAEFEALGDFGGF